MNPGPKLYILRLDERLPSAVRAQWEGLVGADLLGAVSAHKHPLDAERSLAGETLARYALARELACAPSALVFVRAPSGKPKLMAAPGRSGPSGLLPHHSISHAGRFVVCAVAGSPVGADVEVKAVRERIAPWFCHPNELALQDGESDPARLRLRLWTLKESWVKCLETGAGRNMAGLDLSDAVRGKGAGDISFIRAGCAFRSFFAGDAAVAVCVMAG